jgi:two-component system cell cycle sensor histidine kinase/response regulator CckA
MSAILVVDDEPMVRALVAVALEQEGFAVLTAESGADALSLSRMHRGDIGLLITDVTMPEMDGPTLARKMELEDPGLPVLYISGQCDPAEVDLRHGSQFLAKPFSITTLIDQVRNLMREASLNVVN